MAEAGLWTGTELLLWDLDHPKAMPQRVALPQGLTEDTRPSLIAGARTTPRTLPCTALPENVPNGTIPSLTQTNPLTVTHGEEVAMAGFIALNPKFDGILCLPGAQSTLWAHVSAEEIVSMRRFLTGAMVSSALDMGLTLTDEDTFKEALSDTMSRPENAAMRLASAQAEMFQNGMSKAEAASLASAALIGAELAATRAYWLGQSVALIGAAETCAPYRVALDSQFVPFIATNEAAMYRAGFQLAQDRITG
ncbi:2-dehydro-3-deoxygalactonokinase [Celeribacter sp.]|uniref:2-dehydro-3-deoxygalactonokinase n=1 Tax=Celeribacter sp. TaxID=1890673 RepID=UPI003A946107